jgi:uncharacterized protein YutE (UPF0331/DUF86 family)
MIDEEILSRKLSQLNGYIEALEKAVDIDWKKYQEDVRAKAFVERYLHLAIEAVFDLANQIISYEGWREPRGYRDLFLVLSERGVISQDHLITFQNMAGFRNILVHRYDRIEDEVVFGIFKNRLPDFRLFADLIREWRKGGPAAGG